MLLQLQALFERGLDFETAAAEANNRQNSDTQTTCCNAQS
jgi:hypothetical protein